MTHFVSLANAGNQCLTNMNVYLNIERTAHRDSSVIYLDRKPAINGQNDPTQASKIKKDENRMLKK